MRTPALVMLWGGWLLIALAGCSRAGVETPVLPQGPTPLAVATHPRTTPSPAPTEMIPPTTPAQQQGPAPATPMAQPSPTPEAVSPTLAPSPTMTPSLQEGPMDGQEVILTPQQADAEGLSPNPTKFYLRGVELSDLTLRVEGDKPTPCHRLVAEVQLTGEQVSVHLYTRAALGLCMQVLQPTVGTLDLTPFLDRAPAGTYTVVVNGQTAGQITVP